MIANRLKFEYLILLPALGLMVSSGCVRRTVTISTDPQGATVTLNDEVIGTTPVSTDCTWYGDYDVIVRKDGCKTLATHHKIQRPWYQYPPVDLIAEALVPFTIHDRHEMFFELEPAEPVSRDELLDNAYELRDRTLFGED